MKNSIKTFILASLAISLNSCKQNNVSPNSAIASFNVVDANIGSYNLFVNIFNRPVVYANLNFGNYLSYGNSVIYSPISGSENITFTQTTDTLHHLLQGTFNFKSNNIYTFFLTGTVTQPDTVLIHENLPKYALADSVAGIRFINLSPGSAPVSVDIQGQANGSEVKSLAYKGYTNFKTYTANHTMASYTFEFRDQVSGTLLATYTLNGVNTQSAQVSNSVVSRNMTMALIGQPVGGIVPQSIILVPNY